MEKLKDKEELFCQEFIKDLNATQAYKRVNPEIKLPSCRALSSKLLANINIQRKINALIAERSKENKIDANTVLNELHAIATIDPIEIFDDEGMVKPLSEIDPMVRKAIASIEKVEYYEGHGKDRYQAGWIKKIRLWDKNKSLENLGKHLKLFTENLNISHNPFEAMSDEELDKKIQEFLKDLVKDRKKGK
jgi:phage terminase small subunit